MLVFLIICLVGFLVLLVSFVLGEIGDHGDVSHDMEHEVAGGEHDGVIEHAHGGPSILSTRILASFVTGFGGAGAIGCYMGFSYVISSFMGLGTGVVMAGIVYVIVSFLYKQQASSGISVSELVGKSGTVSIAIPEKGVGQIILEAKGATITQFARSESGKAVPEGTVVTVKKIVGDRVIV